MSWLKDYAISNTTECEATAVIPTDNAFCPICGSDDIRPLTNITCECNGCKYDGPFADFRQLADLDFEEEMK